MNGSGVRYLHDLMTSIVRQTYQNYEIIITDHSDNNNIETYLMNNYTNSGIKIRYTRHNYKRGNSSANINMGIKQAKGEIIKPMFQDDIMFSDRCLVNILQNFYLDKTSWGGVGFNHISKDNFIYNGVRHKPQIPLYNDNMLAGENTFGCPSIMYFKNDNNFFDEELIWLMDCEFFYRLYKKYGPPSILHDYLVSVRIWESSVSSQVRDNKAITEKEDLYVLNKHPEFIKKEVKENE